MPVASEALSGRSVGSRHPGGRLGPAAWRSPLRGAWLTSFLGTLLVPAITVIALTGFISHWAYHPELSGNATTNPAFDIPVFLQFPASWPSWDYALAQGTHVTLGLMTIPLVLAKRWSVIPKLFGRPAWRSLAEALERLSLLVLVGSVLVEFATGIFAIEYYSPLGFDFYAIHHYGAWVFGTTFVLRAGVKLPTVSRAYRAHGALKPLRAGLRETMPEPVGSSELAPVEPSPPTISRRGLLAMVGGASLTIFAVQGGESIGGPFRRLALLAPRGRVFGTGANDLQVNTTAASAQVSRATTGPAWRLEVVGARAVSLSRAQLLAMEQATETLTISCTAGWSTTQHWTGVRLADLAQLVGAPPGANLRTASLQGSGANSFASLTPEQYGDERALLALRVNGADLSLDHGYPARVIVPGDRACTTPSGSASSDSRRHEGQCAAGPFPPPVRRQPAAPGRSSHRLRDRVLRHRPDCDRWWLGEVDRAVPGLRDRARSGPPAGVLGAGPARAGRPGAAVGPRAWRRAGDQPHPRTGADLRAPADHLRAADLAEGR
jgi:DMSO/TMAO reductase YedYZ molybdopterin-dependent catalytic subunit